MLRVKSILWTFWKCPLAISLKLPNLCSIHILPLVAPLGFYWVSLRFVSRVIFNAELFVAFPAGWNRGTHCSFRWDERCLSQQRAELSHRLILNSRQLYPSAWLLFQQALFAFRDILPIFLACSLCLTFPALLNCHTGLPELSISTSFTHLGIGWISSKSFLHLGVFCPFFWLAPCV